MSKNWFPGDYTQTANLVIEEYCEQGNTKILRESIYQVKTVMSLALSIKIQRPISDKKKSKIK